MERMNNHFVDCPTELRDKKINFFTTSFNFCAHPLIKTSIKTRMRYFAVLEYLTKSCAIEYLYSDARLSQYRNFLIGTNAVAALEPHNCDAAIKMLIGDFLKPWKRNYRLILFCDIALILLDSTAINKAYEMILKYLSARKQKKFGELLKLLYNDINVPQAFKSVEYLISQFRTNHEFASQQIMRVLVTANMSAGKSTLINALIGKPITRTSQEACTSNLCYLYNKPFEDNRVHLIDSSLNLDATQNDLSNIKRESVSNIASYFRMTGHPKKRICLIDTPGVNFALNNTHGIIARQAIVNENYDMLIYVLNANLLGVDDEINHLKYVYENVPNDKVVFILNKLDCFKKVDDSISTSIDGVKNDLEKIGFKNPIICPMSAYFSLLLKIKQNNEELSEDEQDVFDLYVRKFNKPEYDLSVFYPSEVSGIKPINEDLQKMSFISGLFGLETILYGGASI